MRFALPSWNLLFFAAAGGLMQAFSIASPWGTQPLWWLQILSLSLLIGSLQRCSQAQGAVLGALFAFFWLCASVWWLYISMHIFGGLNAVLTVLSIAALCAFLALYYAAACYFYKRIQLKTPVETAGTAIIFASFWTLAELARDTWFTGFPWAAGGYAHVDGSLAGLAPILGVYGIGFVSAALAAIVAFTFKHFNQAQQSKKAMRQTGAVVFCLLILLAGLEQFKRLGESNKESRVVPVSVSLLQGNIPQSEKFNPYTGIREALEFYGRALHSATTTLVVTPETGIPLLKNQLPNGYWDDLLDRFSRGDQAALVGMPLGNEEQGYTNSVVGLKPGLKLPGQAQTYEYSKHHLVPFGEFVPPFFKWFTQMMNIPLGDFNRGVRNAPSFEWAGQRFAPNICYEDLFGDELAARFIEPEKAPTIMVNLSNIGWFGDGQAIDQHLQISRMRALELRRPMIRATNTGATVIIDHFGHVTHQLPRSQIGVLVGTVQGQTQITPYADWASRWGLWPVWGICLLIVLLAWRKSTQSRVKSLS